MKFKIGDTVLIDSNSPFYGENPKDNPADVLGEVVGIFDSSSYPIEVLWTTGRKNSYPENDLYLVNTSNSSQPIIFN